MGALLIGVTAIAWHVRARGRASYVVLHHPGAAVMVVERIADRAALDRHWRVIAGCVHVTLGFIALSCV